MQQRLPPPGRGEREIACSLLCCVCAVFRCFLPPECRHRPDPMLSQAMLQQVRNAVFDQWAMQTRWICDLRSCFEWWGRRRRVATRARAGNVCAGTRHSEERATRYPIRRGHQLLLRLHVQVKICAFTSCSKGERAAGLLRSEPPRRAERGRVKKRSPRRLDGRVGGLGGQQDGLEARELLEGVLGDVLALGVLAVKGDDAVRMLFVLSRDCLRGW